MSNDTLTVGTKVHLLQRSGEIRILRGGEGIIVGAIEKDGEVFYMVRLKKRTRIAPRDGLVVHRGER